jgi:hypothetical protein
MSEDNTQGNSQLPVVARVGAPSKKTPEILAAICEGIVQGKSARRMCIEVGIGQTTLWQWLEDDIEFQKQYARAKDKGHDLMAEEILDIADESANDTKTRQDGSTYIDNEAVQRSRLRVDARKWYLSKLAPKKYGEKVETVHSGDPANPIQKHITISFKPGITEK